MHIYVENHREHNFVVCGEQGSGGGGGEGGRGVDKCVLQGAGPLTYVA